MNRKTALMLLVLGILMLVEPSLAFAQSDPFANAPSGAQVADNMTNTTNSLFLFIQGLVCLVGFVIACMGVYGFYKVTKEKGQGQTSLPMSITGCVVGMAMIMLPLTIGTLGKSVFGDAAGRPARIQLTPQ